MPVSSVSSNITCVSGIVRSLGDARSALKFRIFGGVANIVCDYLFIVVFHMGIAGAALATIGAQIDSALLTIRYLCKLHPEIALKVTCPMLDGRETLKKLLLVGIPSGIQSMVVSLLEPVYSRVSSTASAWMPWLLCRLFQDRDVFILPEPFLRTGAGHLYGTEIAVPERSTGCERVHGSPS